MAKPAEQPQTEERLVDTQEAIAAASLQTNLIKACLHNRRSHRKRMVATERLAVVCEATLMTTSP